MNETAAFIYFGYQFLNFAKGKDKTLDQQRHFGIAVDDKELARIRLGGMGIDFLCGRFLDFLYPWGNWVKITTYIHQHTIPYTKADHVLKGRTSATLKKRRRLGRVKKKKIAP